MSTEVVSHFSDSSNIEPRSSITKPNDLELSNLQSTSSKEDRNQVMELKFQEMFNSLSKKLQEQEKIINELSKSANKAEKNSKDIKAIQEQLKDNSS